MTSATGQSDIETVRDATDLVRLVGDHVALSPRGREFVGLCPFHDDQHPSLAVVTHKGDAFYHCFACGASGDCFRFVMDYHKMEFGEALRYLADRAGITLQRRERATTHEGGAIPRATLRKALDHAEAFYRRTLQDPQAGAAAREAISARGISGAMVEQFGLGAAPTGFDGILRSLGGEPSAVAAALAAGVLRQGRSGDGAYDTLRHRLVFPISDEIGRLVAFGGRILDPDDQPKYLNSPETPLFRKSRTLYGLHLAKRKIIEQRQAVVTEGYTDVIACHQAGLANVVGTLGTALTTEHAAVLSRMCDTVVLVFDGDEAGRRAADRAVEVFFAAPIDVKICDLPDGRDPDELLREQDGPERFRAAIDGAVDALEYKLRRFQEGLARAGGLSARQKHLEGFLQELADLGFGAMQGVRKRLVITRLADLLGLSMADVERALPRPARRTGRTPAAPPASTSDDVPGPLPDAAAELLPDESAPPEPSRARRIAEHDVIAILLYEPAAARDAEVGSPSAEGDEAGEPPVGPTPFLEAITPADFHDPAARAIARVLLLRLAAGETVGMAEILTQLPEGGGPGLAAELFREGRRRCGDDEGAAVRELASAAAVFRDRVERDRYEQHAASARAALAAGGAAGGTSEAATGGLDVVLEQISRRNRQRHLPAAISQGIRS